MDSNKTRNRRSKEWYKNKRAFDEIIGDPFAPDIIDGVYNSLRQSSSLSSIEAKYGEAPGIKDAAKPSIMDFFCDVDMVIRSIVDDTFLRSNFEITYFCQLTDHVSTLGKEHRNKYEQLIGKELLRRGISPVKRYFTVTKFRRS